MAEKAAGNAFVDWYQNVGFDLNDFRYGMLTGVGLLVLQTALPTIAPIFSMSGFAYKFSFDAPYQVLFTIATKVLVETMHQVDIKNIDASTAKWFDNVEIALNFLVMPIEFFSGSWFLLGLTLVDLAQNVALSKVNPWV